ncbi:Ankyrin repeat [Tistlia consotensis]|uniref:Ankyrin repeat n=1 Tax=Tistlia consotensis USBA 355 TaxID=560819 RepID=A0A1Y6CGR5_9PROT|nr:ankyrin repeat domain-containing protein [Tistlia consotensis]SMF54237.1 Ankyrin repeat [Tistlia consotensis USBA 355]SNR86719.1 Ankyrin repeat [Tistlia consotensis]
MAGAGSSRKAAGLAASACVVALLLGAGGALAQTGSPDDAPAVYSSKGAGIACNEIAQDIDRKKADGERRELDFLLFDAAGRGCLAEAETLVEAGAAIEARDRFGNTPLLIAARMGHEDLVAYLLGQHAAVGQTNLAGSSALLRAVLAGRRKVVELLLSAGADPNLANKQGVTPLDAATFSGEARLVKILLAAGADPQAEDRSGKAPIVYAAGRGFTQVVKILLDAGVDPNRRYGNDLTALMWAAGHANDAPEAEGLATVELLLARGAKVGPLDNRGRNALMIAAERGHSLAVKALLEAGADPAIRDGQGKTALDLAADDAVRQALAR